ncbi:MAG: small subunit of monooxygenase [Polaromonas sp.]|nr:small subunit of monooxygenase [Polaromonas sp.]
MPLNLLPNFAEPGRHYRHAFSAGDDFYEALIETHLGLSDEQSAVVNARLVLLLSNHIGDMAVLREAMRIARDGA